MTPTVAPAPYVLIPVAAVIIGLTVKAIERKIEQGIWLEGREYRRAPDGRIYISIKGFEQWVEMGSMSGKTPSGSRSRLKADSSAKH